MPKDERDAVQAAFEKAKKKLWEAYEIICGSVDGDSDIYDRVVSYAYDIEDLITSLTIDEKKVFE